jgi:phosphoribosylformylglycinamidine cyclo-ligase
MDKKLHMTLKHIVSTAQHSGININLGDDCSRKAYNWAKQTFGNRAGKAGMACVKVDGGFANLLDFNGVKIGISSDGIGTKIEVAERTGIYHTLGFDLMAMIVDDLAANGIEPTTLSNILDVDFLDPDIIDDLMRGLHDAANECGVAVSGGEIAELGTRMNGYGPRMHFNWCATGIGILHPNLKKPIDGSAVQAGDAVMAFQSRGFRSNGFSLLRTIMREQFGAEWHTVKYDDAQTWGEVLLTPSRIFAPMICRLLSEGVGIKGIAHITGGGIASNFERVTKVNTLEAALDHLFPPLEMMQKIMELGQITAETAYRYWNMGNGMLFVITPSEADAVIRLSAECGFNARRVGTVIPKRI